MELSQGATQRLYKKNRENTLKLSASERVVREKSWKELLNEERQKQRQKTLSSNIQQESHGPGMQKFIQPNSANPQEIDENMGQELAPILSDRENTPQSEEEISQEINRARAKTKDQQKETTTTSALNTAVKRKVSAIVLKWAWLTLIPSFGLTLIYLNFHLLGAYLAHISWFCKFGEEWSIGPVSTRSKALEILEVIGVILLDLFLVALVAPFLMFAMYIGYCVENPGTCLVDIIF